jgi:hypothetical protein
MSHHHLHYEIARSRQQEIATRVSRAHLLEESGPAAVGTRRSVTSRVGRAAAAISICLATATAVTVSGAHASQRPSQAGSHISGSTLSREIRALETKGYAPYQCTAKGTLMRDSRTGRFALVRW